jgi:hypothetical protein
LSKNASFFAKFFGENILKIITSVPRVMHVGTKISSNTKYIGIHLIIRDAVYPTYQRVNRWNTLKSRSR